MNKPRIDFVENYGTWIVCAFIILSIAAVYWQVSNHEFIAFDDGLYVTENVHIKKGFTAESIKWAFSFNNEEGFYWHPLVWGSHIIDYHLFGLNSAAHHLVNVLFHIINAIMLFVMLRLMTGSLWRSAFVASLFALHPVNVDTVAWVAERKNLLSTFFWLLTMISYLYYTKKMVISRYLLMVTVFALGLMVKPMLVTLPCVLLLMDYWPLRRIALSVKADVSPGMPTPIAIQNLPSSRVLWEKVPMLALSVIVIFIASASLDSANFIITTAQIPMSLRLENIAVTFPAYIGKMLFPFNLAIYYPFPSFIPTLHVFAGSMILTAITIFAISTRKKYPYVITGWLWFLGTLMPVSGLIQGGLWPEMADRWAYIPFVGLFIIVAWGAADLCEKWPTFKIWTVSAAAVVLITLFAITWHQLGYWQNNITLFKHAAAVTSDNHVAHSNLALSYNRKKDYNNALRHAAESLRIMPNPKAYMNMGNALEKQGKLEESLQSYYAAIRLKPNDMEAYGIVSYVLRNMGNYDKAVEVLNKAIRIRPDFAPTYNYMGIALAEQGKTDEAMKSFAMALEKKPDYDDPHINIGNVLYKQDDLDEAIAEYGIAIQLNPDNAKGHNNMGTALIRKGSFDKAAWHLNQALKLQPDMNDAREKLEGVASLKSKIDGTIAKTKVALENAPENMELLNKLGNLYRTKGDMVRARESYEKALAVQNTSVLTLNNLAVLHAATGEYSQAVIYLQKIVVLRPDGAGAYYNLACVYAKQNKKTEAIGFLKQAMDKGFKDWPLMAKDPDLKNIRETEYYTGLMSRYHHPQLMYQGK